MLTTEETTQRQKGLLNPNSIPPVMVIGLGSIGGFVVQGLVKMGIPELVGFDFDTVAPHNLGNQVYQAEDIGKPKAEALERVVAGDITTGQRVSFYNQPWTGRELTILKPIVVSAVDTLAIRQKIYTEVAKTSAIMIDARTGGEVWKVYSVKAEDKDNYAKEFAPAIRKTCGADGTIYVTLRVVSQVLKTVKQVATGVKPDYLVQGVEK